MQERSIAGIAKGAMPAAPGLLISRATGKQSPSSTGILRRHAESACLRHPAAPGFCIESWVHEGSIAGVAQGVMPAAPRLVLSMLIIHDPAIAELDDTAPVRGILIGMGDLNDSHSLTI